MVAKAPLFKEVNILEENKNMEAEVKATKKDASSKDTASKDKKVKKEKAKQKSPIEQFFTNLAAEFKKIVWPSREDLIKQTIVVIIISLFMGVLIFGLDALFNFLQTLLTRLAA
jgi:preprotein translocase subunit SecE